MEKLIGGGMIVRLQGGSVGVEGVPNAKRGVIVQSESHHAVGGVRMSGRYRLTQRAVKGTDLWRVQRVLPIVIDVVV